jgi:hypothetical protein
MAKVAQSPIYDGEFTEVEVPAQSRADALPPGAPPIPPLPGQVWTLVVLSVISIFMGGVITGNLITGRPFQTVTTTPEVVYHYSPIGFTVDGHKCIVLVDDQLKFQYTCDGETAPKLTGFTIHKHR